MEVLPKGIYSSVMKATYLRKYLKRRIMYSYGHRGSFNPAVIANKEAHMIYGGVKNKTGSSQIRKFLPPLPVLLIKFKGQTEALTRYFERKEIIFHFIELKLY